MRTRTLYINVQNLKQQNVHDDFRDKVFVFVAHSGFRNILLPDDESRAATSSVNAVCLLRTSCENLQKLET